MSHFDAIVAPISGNPPSAVGWIRVSGEGAWFIAGKIFRPWPTPVEARRVLYGRLVNGDDGLALPFAAGHSYTGEECVELSMHGSLASLRLAVEACLAAGARLAEPGEFTQRAFLNGRIDLTQAEAVRDLVEAQTELQLRQATRNRDGALRAEVEAIRELVLGQLAAVEASVDFSEEIGDLDRGSMADRLNEITVRIEGLFGGERVSRIIRDGYRVAIVGPPNAGKSSLLNRLLGTNRSIVTPIPGTTRDYIEERADFSGVPVVLVDTAGLRRTDDVVEALGIELARKIARESDEVWFLYDASVGFVSAADEAFKLLDCPNAVILANKSEGLEGSRSPVVGLPCSAKTGLNVDELIRRIQNTVLERAPAIAINERHASILSEVRGTLIELRVALDADGPDDLLSVLLRDIAEGLGRITGQTAEVDMIDRIFHDFCIGK